jgi:hypothetical protein
MTQQRSHGSSSKQTLTGAAVESRSKLHICTDTDLFVQRASHRYSATAALYCCYSCQAITTRHLAAHAVLEPFQADLEEESAVQLSA